MFVFVLLMENVKFDVQENETRRRVIRKNISSAVSRLFNNAGLNEKKTLINYSEGRFGVITSLKQTTQRHKKQKKSYKPSFQEDNLNT